MSERLAAVLSGIADAEIARVAAAAIGIAGAALAGPPDVHDLISPHNDRRTLAIKRFSGIASAEGSKRRWSAVCKIVDLDVAPGSVSTWVRPENEQAVYQEEYFVNDSLRFRPARCYHTSIPLPGIAVLWLEDLTTAKGPPFAPADLAQMLRHLGEWNGFHAARAPSLRFKLGEDSVYTRWAAWNYDADLADFRSMRHRPEVRAMYGDRSIEIVFELRDLLLQINQRARTHPHALCFGDCNIGNLFLRRDETVAVDWASLTSDPLGADAGCLLGSAITWGRRFGEVAENERDLFRHYFDGLLASGWRGNADDVRRGHLVHFGFYLLIMAMMPASLKKYAREQVELRSGARWDELPLLAADIVNVLPSYLREMGRLLS